MKTYSLPDGKTTRSATRYVREWNRLSRPVAKALGCEVIAMDPSIQLKPKSGAPSFQIPVSVARRILDFSTT